MKPILSLILMFVGSLIFAQETLFVYKVRYKSDSLAERHQSVNYALLLGKETVKFFPYEALVNDSIFKQKGEYQYVSKSIGFDYRLKRKINDDENVNYYSKSPLYYSVKTQDKAPKWQLHPDTKMIDNYKVQRATADFGGRSWEAWYTSDIAIPEGPYKFRGLPGMILEIYDTKSNFLFQLVEIKKMPKSVDTSTFLENLNQTKALPITEKQWVKLQMDYYKNPGKDFKGGTIYVQGKDGQMKAVQMDSKEMVEGTQKLLKKHNNPIELDKAMRYP